MAEKFHVGARRIYEIWNNSERLQQGLILSSSDQPALDKNSQFDKLEQTLEAVSSISLLATDIPKKNGRKKKVKIDEKPVTEATSMVEKITKMAWSLPLIIRLIHPEKAGQNLFLKI
ncbi:unnamed protein product [Rhizophagus irregularis]|nr:unnamed protein product [Rhizophagus irregularis]